MKRFVLCLLALVTFGSLILADPYLRGYGQYGPSMPRFRPARVGGPLALSETTVNIRSCQGIQAAFGCLSTLSGRALGWGVQDSFMGPLQNFSATSLTWRPTFHHPRRVPNTDGLHILDWFPVATVNAFDLQPYTAVFLTTNGIYTQGYNVYGMLGVGDTDETRISELPIPVDLDLGTVKVTHIETNYLTRSIALLSNGTVVGWGENSGLALGICGSGPIQRPTIVPNLPPMKRIATSASISFGCDQSGAVWSWGATLSSQQAALRGRDVTQSSTICSSAVYGPGTLDIGTSSCVELSAGQQLAAVLTDEPAVWVWGIGLSNVPLKVTFPYSFTPLQVAAGNDDILIFGISSVAGRRELWVITRTPELARLDSNIRYQIGSAPFWIGKSQIFDESFFDNYDNGDFTAEIPFKNRGILSIASSRGQWLFLTDANEVVSYVSGSSGFTTSGTDVESTGFVINPDFVGKKFTSIKFGALLQDDGASGVIWSRRADANLATFQLIDWDPNSPILPLTGLQPSSSRWVDVVPDQYEVSPTVGALDANGNFFLINAKNLTKTQFPTNSVPVTFAAYRSDFRLSQCIIDTIVALGALPLPPKPRLIAALLNLVVSLLANGTNLISQSSGSTFDQAAASAAPEQLQNLSGESIIDARFVIRGSDPSDNSDSSDFTMFVTTNQTGARNLFIQGRISQNATNFCGISSPATVFGVPERVPLPSQDIIDISLSTTHVSALSSTGQLYTCVFDNQASFVVSRSLENRASERVWYPVAQNVIQIRNAFYATFYRNSTGWYGIGDDVRGNLARNDGTGLSIPRPEAGPVAPLKYRSASNVISSYTRGTTWVTYPIVVNEATTLYSKATILKISGFGFLRPTGLPSDVVGVIQNEFGNSSAPCDSTLSSVVNNTLYECILQDPMPFFGEIFFRATFDGENVDPIKIGSSVPEAEITPSSDTITGKSNILTIRGRFPATETAADLLVEFSDLNLICTPIQQSTSSIVCSLSTRVPALIRPGPLQAQISFFGGLPSFPAVVAQVLPDPIVETNENEVPTSISKLTIQGSNFGTNQSAIDLLTLGVHCSSWNLTSDSSIECSIGSFTDAPPATIQAAVVRREVGGSSEIDLSAVPFSIIARTSGPANITAPSTPLFVSSNVALIRLDGVNLGSNSSQLEVTLFVVSNNKRATVTIACVNVRIVLDQVTCTPSTALPAGILQVSISRMGAPGPIITIGTVLASATLQDTSATQILGQSASIVVIRGSGFTVNQNSAVDSLILSSESTPSIGISCTIREVQSTQLTCSIPAVESLRPLGPLLANITVLGGLLSPSPVATIVSNPIVTADTSSRSEAGTRSSAVPFVISGRSFGYNGVLASDFKVYIDYNNQTGLVCAVAGSSTYNSSSNLWTISCSVQTLNLSSPGLILASVEAFGAKSGPGVQIFEIFPSPQIAVEAAPPLSSGAIAAIVVSIAAFCLLMIYPIILIRRYYRQWAQDQKFKSQIPSEMRSMFNISTSELKMFNKLGEGSFGAVFRGMYKGRFVAIKKLSNAILSDQVAAFFAEASLMLSIKPHINIVRTYGMCQEAHNLSMVMELIPNGSLDKLIEREQIGPEKQFDEILFFRLVRGIAVGMRQLASQGVVHRDLATRNVLLGAGNEPKVADFGMSRVVSNEDASSKTATTMGPIRWMPPESLAQLEYSQKSDVWAYGATIIEMLTGKEPYAGQQLIDVAVGVRDAKITPLDFLPDNLNLKKSQSWIRKLLEMCFRFEASKRPTFSEIVLYLDKHAPSGFKAAKESDVDLMLDSKTNDDVASATVGATGATSGQYDDAAALKTNRTTNKTKKQKGSREDPKHYDEPSVMDNDDEKEKIRTNKTIKKEKQKEKDPGSDDTEIEMTTPSKAPASNYSQKMNEKKSSKDSKSNEKKEKQKEGDGGAVEQGQYGGIPVASDQARQDQDKVKDDGKASKDKKKSKSTPGREVKQGEYGSLPGK